MKKLVCGTLEFRVVDDFLNYKGEVTKVPRFGTIRPALTRVFESISCIILMVITSILFRQDYMYDPTFADKAFPIKVIYLIGCNYVTVWRLLFAFGMIEANLIANGISYRAKTEKEPEEFNSIRHVKMWDFVKALTGVNIISNWNMCTQSWIKYYILMRLLDRNKPKGKVQAMPLFLSFIFSAIWHGVDLGYFVFFITLFFNDFIAKQFALSKLAHTI